MHRLFVALRPPPEIRAELALTMAGVGGARWQDDAQFHLTLRFIGEVDRHAAEDIASALALVRGGPITVEAAGVGCFGPDARPNSLWIGVKLSEPLDRLRLGIERRLAAVGIEPERRAFRPHITVARLARSAGPVDRWLVDHAGLRLPAFTVDRFALFESTLGRAGSAYEEVASYPLG